ncbi:MAG TPA: hypothetical protein PLC97_03740 [Myxococcota bacterium]|nr:hypothetical protein [Myxococcota bacterium]
MKSAFSRVLVALALLAGFACGGGGEPQISDEECEAAGKVVVGKDCLPKCKEGQGGECACGGGEVWEKCAEGNVCKGTDVAGKCEAIADAPECEAGKVTDELCICGSSECSVGNMCLGGDCFKVCAEGESNCACGQGDSWEQCKDALVCARTGDAWGCAEIEPVGTDCETGEIAGADGCTCGGKECDAGKLCLIAKDVGSCHDICAPDAATDATCQCKDLRGDWHVCGEGGYCRLPEIDGGCAEPCAGLGVTGCFCGDARTYCGAGSVCAEVDQDVGCIPECNGESGAEACWCEFNDQLSTTVCKDGNRCTNEGCKCGDKAPCTNGSTCKDGVCICGDDGECGGSNRCVEGECKCGVQDEDEWTNPGCKNGADCDSSDGKCVKAVGSEPILSYSANKGHATEWYTDAENKVRGVVCDEDHTGVRLCRGNETGAKVGWAECNGENWRIMEECAAEELCSDGMGCVRSCGPEADCGASGSCADASVYLELLGDVYDATGKVEAGITKICMCGQGLGCRGEMGCQMNLYGVPGQCASNGAFDDVVLAASNCRAGEFLFGIGKDGQKICTCGESMKSCRGAGHCKTTKTSSEQWPHQAGQGWMCGLPAGQELPGDASAYCYDKETLGEYSSFGPICRCGDNKPCKWNGECSGDVCKDNSEDGTGCYESESTGADRICRCGGMDEPCSPGQICVSINTDGGSVCQAAKWQGIGSARLVTLSLSLPCSEDNPFCGPGEFCFGSDGCRCGKAPGCGSGDVCAWSWVTNKWECL